MSFLLSLLAEDAVFPQRVVVKTRRTVQDAVLVVAQSHMADFAFTAEESEVAR